MDQNGSEQSLAMGNSRWNPTAEQLLALEEMYRCGTRTPTADQIQQIATHLRRFGKIEGKNVFYWFQNHKARERQKRRREILQKHHSTESLNKKESGFTRRTIQEVDETTNLSVPQSSKCSDQHVEGHVPVHGGAEIAESRTSYEWWSEEIEEGELRQQKTSSGSLHMHATWKATSTCSTTLMKNPTSWPRSDDDRSHEIREVQTLQLFPLGIKADRNNNGINDDVRKVPICRTINTNLSPDQFFEFLPLKD